MISNSRRVSSSGEIGRVMEEQDRRRIVAHPKNRLEPGPLLLAQFPRESVDVQQGVENDQPDRDRSGP